MVREQPYTEKPYVMLILGRRLHEKEGEKAPADEPYLRPGTPLVGLDNVLLQEHVCALKGGEGGLWKKKIGVKVPKSPEKGPIDNNGERRTIACLFFQLDAVLLQGTAEKVH